MFDLTPVTRNLIIINVVIMVLVLIGVDLITPYALYGFSSEYFKPYQIFTYIFLHGGFGHLFSNMFGLFIFGPILEKHWGPKRFLIFYIVTGIGAGLLYGGINYIEHYQMIEFTNIYIQSPNFDQFSIFLNKYYPAYINDIETNDFVAQFASTPQSDFLKQESTIIVQSFTNAVINNSKLIGASGAIFGILVAFAMLYPNVSLFLLFIPVPIKAKYLIGFYILYEIYWLVQNVPSDNVAHFAHLAGALIGFVLVKIWKK